MRPLSIHLVTPVLLGVILLALPCAVMAQPPQMTYQGELLKNGVPYEGSAQFKFVIHRLGVSLWSNDGSSVGGAEPSTDISLPVSNGIFTVQLGDPALFPLPLVPEDLGTAPDVVLRVWVNTGEGFEQLSDTPLSSAPFAINSETAMRSLGEFTVPGELYAFGGIRFSDGTLQTTAGSGSGADSDWLISGDDMYSGVSGHVGIGTSNPLEKFHVIGRSRWDLGSGQFNISTPGGWPGLIAYSPNGHRRDITFENVALRLSVGATSAAPDWLNGLSILENGNVAIGLLDATSRLEVEGTTRSDRFQMMGTGEVNVDIVGFEGIGGVVNVFRPGGLNGVRLRGDAYGGGLVSVYNEAGIATAQIEGNPSSPGAKMYLSNGDHQTFTVNARAFGQGSQVRLFDSVGSVSHEMTAANREMKFFDANGSVRVFITANTPGSGKITTDVLQITGGADFSEQFDVAEDALLEPGMAVSIDLENPGALELSRQAYDKRVAGVISGAGGVRPGMLMSQSGTMADGEHPVALSGRVWTWCDATTGSIEPGDLLTTSDRAGHAMKAMDHEASQGAILGKAMTHLREGTGLVLVLVNLQ